MVYSVLSDYFSYQLHEILWYTVYIQIAYFRFLQSLIYSISWKITISHPHRHENLTFTDADYKQFLYTIPYDDAVPSLSRHSYEPVTTPGACVQTLHSCDFPNKHCILYFTLHIALQPCNYMYALRPESWTR